MKYIQRFLFIICLVISFNVQAQQNHFIYIQADGKQPFYVKLDKKIYSSSASGYLILSKLKAGGYDLMIGFPQNEWPEQAIQCKVDDADLGYLLKNFGEKGWGLFNLQSLNIVMSAVKEVNRKVDTVMDVKGDAFSNMLSEVVNDPTIKQKEPIKQEAKIAVAEKSKTSVVNAEPLKEKISEAVKTEAIKEVSKKADEALPKTIPVSIADPAKDNIAEAVKEDKKKAIAEPPLVVQSPIATAEPAKDKAIDFKREEEKNNIAEQQTAVPAISAVEKNKEAAPVTPGTTKAPPSASVNTIVKKMSSKTSLGIEVIYIDIFDGLSDTISVFIATDRTDSDTVSVKKSIEEKVMETAKSVVIKEVPVKKEEKKEADKVIDMTVPAPTSPAKENKTDSAQQQSTSKIPIINSDCKEQASQDVFLKLRKKMASANNEEMMINIAKKAFKSRCFLTEQIKNLGALFLKDEKRYGFFDAAYPFVSDSQNFAILESQLTDGYYINRFKVMIRH